MLDPIVDPKTFPADVLKYYTAFRDTIDFLRASGLQPPAFDSLHEFQGSDEPVGIATARAPFDGLEFAPWDSIVLGGHDVCRRSLSESAGELVRHGILPADLVAGASSHAAEFESRIRAGIHG